MALFLAPYERFTLTRLTAGPGDAYMSFGANVTRGILVCQSVNGLCETNGLGWRLTQKGVDTLAAPETADGRLIVPDEKAVDLAEDEDDIDDADDAAQLLTTLTFEETHHA